MPKVRRGGYVFIARKGLIVKWDLENKKPMKGKASAKILELIEQLEGEGQL